MFTGIISAMGEIMSVRKGANMTELTVKSHEISNISNTGDSISVNGVCLTIVKKDGDMISFDLSEETIKSSNLGYLLSGSRVNLEPAMGADGRFGGHFVTGHVDAVGFIRYKQRRGEGFIIHVEVPHSLLRYLVKKGSVAIDGVSLTVVDVMDNSFSVMIIPHTARMTTLGMKGVGDSVNLEGDMIGKYVEKFVSLLDHFSKRDRDISLLEKLREEGYAR